VQIDINCDLGEGATVEACVQDEVLMNFISRCNIACGGHAGNHSTMSLSVENALEHNLAVGAHPGYPDRENFGRKSLSMPGSELVHNIAKQIEALSDITSHASARLDHIKLHGALYNDAEADPKLAHALVAMINRHFPHLKILGLANASMEAAARELGQPFLREGFMDRRYLNDHQLAPRSQAGAVIDDFSVCIKQTMSLITGHSFPSITGTSLAFSVDSICLHGDNPQAEQIASRLHRALREANLRICA
jgi:5-oxoprolinase (ATP-hydrolysing) subunit A